MSTITKTVTETDWDAIIKALSEESKPCFHPDCGAEATWIIYSKQCPCYHTMCEPHAIRHRAIVTELIPVSIMLNKEWKCEDCGVVVPPIHSYNDLFIAARIK